MEEHASYVAASLGISIRVVGFDTGTGLPAPADYRDVQYVWAQGFYPMDDAELRSRLRVAELVLGDVRQTVRPFLDRQRHSLRSHPIGFVSFDLDYCSSTTAAFDVIQSDADVCLPRVTCYFDNVPRTTEDIGELRAIRDFNEEAHSRRIRSQHNLRALLPFHPPWAEQIRQAHLLDHPQYDSLLADPDARAGDAQTMIVAHPRQGLLRRTHPGAATSRGSDHALVRCLAKSYSTFDQTPVTPRCES